MPTAANTAALLQEALAHAHASRHTRVLDACKRILDADPRNPEALWLRAATYLNLGRLAEARKSAEASMSIRPRDPRPHHQVATIHLLEGRFDEVDQALDRAEKECGPHPLFVALRAERRRTVADYEGAYQACKPLLDADTDHPVVLTAAARACLRTDRIDEGISLIQRRLGRPGLHPSTRAPLLCVLADLLDAAGRHDEAFLAMKEANTLRKPALDPALQTAAIDRYIAAWDRSTIAGMPRGAPTDLPIFIVGFWRSGTTLVEQTLSSHSKVFGAGELGLIREFAVEQHDPKVPSNEALVLNPRALNRSTVFRFSRAYLAHLRKLSADAERITDKMPVNFLHLGLIWVLFPGARIIHCLRDPVDTCVSCYFNLQGHTPYARDLRALGSFYRDYRRLMDHWKSVLDIPMTEVVYEDFVASQESTARRLVDFIGLPWDDACLRHHENPRVALTRSIDQVRQPMYASSVARWKRYEKNLDPLLDALGPFAPKRD